ncbi:MAG: hypothetical protein SF029_02365 [bacterium]|nr:hypothetical protein [bacterium]
MENTPFYVYYSGKESLDPAPLRLQCGPFDLLYEAGTIRYIRLGSTEVVRQIYSAVRDQNWTTIPGVLSDVQITNEADFFQITFVSHHQQDEIDFRWRGLIEGTPESLTFEMAGEAHSQFKRNRIGFCVLHPMECAGLSCKIEHTDQTISEGHFPQQIEPHQPFLNICSIQHEFQPGSWVEVRMEGETFEMEDQRNWIDASYKTYCTALSLPFPVTVEPGTRIEQKITLRLLSSTAVSAGERQKPLTLTLNEARTVPLPAIGLGAASHHEPLSDRAVERLKALHLVHLRVDVRPDESDWQQPFTRDAEAAKRLDVPLEIAVHLGSDLEAQLQAVRSQVEIAGVRVARWLIFRKGEKSTRRDTMERAKRVLQSDAPLVGGTDAFFTELNRERPDMAVMDGVVYSINPQVHAFDNATLVETLAVQEVTVTSARAFSGEKLIHVGPVTFKMRWNPNATAPQPPLAPGEIPPQADARQMSLFGAGWTLGSVKYLALGGAASLTYFETTGYLGVMSTETGSLHPDKFRDFPGGVFPMYFVFAHLGEFAGGELIDLTTSDGLWVDGLALRKGDRMRLLLANFTQDAQRIRLAAPGRYQQITLDGSNVAGAMQHPQAYFDQPRQRLEPTEGVLHLELAPYALIVLDRIAS